MPVPSTGRNGDTGAGLGHLIWVRTPGEALTGVVLALSHRREASASPSGSHQPRESVLPRQEMPKRRERNEKWYFIQLCAQMRGKEWQAHTLLHSEAFDLPGGSIRQRQKWKSGLETGLNKTAPNKRLRVNGGGILQKD